MGGIGVCCRSERDAREEDKIWSFNVDCPMYMIYAQVSEHKTQEMLATPCSAVPLPNSTVVSRSIAPPCGPK